MSALRYLKSRLGEKSTWAGIGVAIAGGAALPPPYSWLMIGVGVVASLVPTKGKGEG